MCTVKHTETHPFLSPLSCPHPTCTAHCPCPPLVLDFTFKLSSSSTTTTAHQMCALQWHCTPQCPQRPLCSLHTHPCMVCPLTSPFTLCHTRCTTLQCLPLPAFDMFLLTVAPPMLDMDSANTHPFMVSDQFFAACTHIIHTCSRTSLAWPLGASVVLRQLFRISLLLTLAQPYGAAGDAARRKHTVSYILRPITLLSLPTHLQHPSSTDLVSFLSPPLLTKHTSLASAPTAKCLPSECHQQSHHASTSGPPLCCHPMDTVDL